MVHSDTSSAAISFRSSSLSWPERMVATVISTARLPLLSADVSHDGSVVVAFESSQFTPPGPSFRRVHPSPLGLRTPALGPLRFPRSTLSYYFTKEDSCATVYALPMNALFKMRRLPAAALATIVHSQLRSPVILTSSRSSRHGGKGSIQTVGSRQHVVFG